MMPVFLVRTLRAGQDGGLVARAAYCGRCRLYDEHRARVHDFSRRPGLAWSELSSPDVLPAHLADPERFWNAVEIAGARGPSRRFREVIMGLPRGWPLSLHAAFMRDFITGAFVSRGQAVDWHIHYDRARNLHAHALVSPAEAWVAHRTATAAPTARPGGPLGPRAQWYRHCARWGLAGDPVASPYACAQLAPVHALVRRGVVTRDGHWRAALRSRLILPPNRHARGLPRRRQRVREAPPRKRPDLARDR